MEGQYPDWWKKKGAASTSNTQKPKSVMNIVTTDGSVGSTNWDGEFYALATNTSPNQTIDLPCQVITFTDSACSDHCFVNKSDFITCKPFHDKDGNTAVKGGRFKISGTGWVEKCVVFDGHVVSLAFKNAIHAPDLNHNLISIRRLDKARCYTVFGGGGMTCLNCEGKPFLAGKPTRSERTMYEVETHSSTGLLYQK